MYNDICYGGILRAKFELTALSFIELQSRKLGQMGRRPEGQMQMQGNA